MRMIVVDFKPCEDSWLIARDYEEAPQIMKKTY